MDLTQKIAVVVEQIRQSLLAYYPLIQDGADLSDRGRHASLSGAVAWGAGRFGFAADFSADGAFGVISAPEIVRAFDVGRVSATAGLTMAFWAHPVPRGERGEAPNLQTLVGPLSYSIVDDHLYWAPDGIAAPGVRLTPMEPGRWTHVCVSFEPVLRLLDVYLDGERKAQLSVGIPHTASPQQIFLGGRNTPGPWGLRFVGRLQHLMLLTGFPTFQASSAAPLLAGKLGSVSLLPRSRKRGAPFLYATLTLGLAVLFMIADTPQFVSTIGQQDPSAIMARNGLPSAERIAQIIGKINNALHLNPKAKLGRDELGLVGDETIHIDYFGEGIKGDDTLYAASDQTINVNHHRYQGKNKPTAPHVPNLVYLPSYDTPLPFANDTIDFLTFNGSPLGSDDTPGNYYNRAHEEIARVMRAPGWVELRVMNSFGTKVEELIKMLKERDGIKPQVELVEDGNFLYYHILLFQA